MVGGIVGGTNGTSLRAGARGEIWSRRHVTRQLPLLILAVVALLLAACADLAST